DPRRQRAGVERTPARGAARRARGLTSTPSAAQRGPARRRGARADPPRALRADRADRSDQADPHPLTPSPSIRATAHAFGLAQALGLGRKTAIEPNEAVRLVVL